ncbi:MAG TPA: large-conductance mechanosensitive channel protein MscL [Pirellulales bacterium]|nr:large-conductance mechanosensitive channel protein MscL [Pirellulales bacterium]
MMFKEFKEFALKGNVVDMAVGIIIGAAFGKIVASLVNDVIMPPLGVLIGGLDFKDLAYPLRESIGDQPAVSLKYGAFLNNVIDFLIIAFTMFIAAHQMNRLTRLLKIADGPTTKPCPRCVTSIPLKATRCPHCTSEIETV